MEDNPHQKFKHMFSDNVSTLVRRRGLKVCCVEARCAININVHHLREVRYGYL